MPSALLLAAVQLLKMNAKLAAALPPPCFLLHLIARFKFHPESLGKQRITPLQELQQGLFFFCAYSLWLLQLPHDIPKVLASLQAGTLARAGWAEIPAGFCYDAACSLWSQAQLFGAGHLLGLHASASLPRYILQSGSSCSLWASFSLWNPSLSTSSSFWKPSFSSPESLCVARVHSEAINCGHISLFYQFNDSGCATCT